jgi:beta-galactosidase
MRISRRKLLQGTLAASTAAIFNQSRVANALGLLGQTAALVGQSGLEPRLHLLLDRNWRFTLGNAADPSKDLGFDGPDDFSKQKTKFKFARPEFDDSRWRKLDLPHDWGIELEHVHDERNKMHGYHPLGRKYPETSVGWYRRLFTLPDGSEGKRFLLEFDGVYRNAQVFVNGFYLGLNESGYAPFSYDITDFLDYKGKNAITVRVDVSHGDGWFYEGAGIYRHVWLTVTDQLYLEPWESVVRTEGYGDTTELHLQTVVGNRTLKDAKASVSWQIFDAENTLIATASAMEATLPADGKQSYMATASLTRPALWTPEAPNLYRAVITLESAGQAVDRDAADFGVRTVEFTADRGMLLNGKRVKLKGVCNHQDHACVGTALPDRLNYYRTELLVGMGCNAVRTAHNYPTPELIDACDRLGILVLCETRTFSTSPKGQAELGNMVRRYRNHPSVVLWSLGNEEREVQGADDGKRIAARNQQLAYELDPTRKCTVAMDDKFGQGISTVIGVQGFNYHLGDLEAYHQQHPQQLLVGTETASLVSTRGIYVTDPTKNTLSAYDDNAKEKKVYWGSSAEDWWKMYGEHDYLSGGFAWTGFDYRGEPIPFAWPTTNSQFGIMDLCGFPKDEYFYYKAWWTKEPVLHLLPHWNWDKAGDPIRVWVYSNLDSVELFLNGRSLGTQTVPHFGHLEWPTIAYEPGVLEARGTKNGNVVLTERRETTGVPAALRLSADRATIHADGEDVSVLKLEVVDDKGRVVPTACIKVNFTLTGDGRLLGLGNGNPNSLELDKRTEHSTFNGLAQAIVQAARTSGAITLAAESAGLRSAEITITTKAAYLRPSLD